MRETTKNMMRLTVLFALPALGILGYTQTAQKLAGTRVPLVFTGGHETDPRDHGRPVNLVAGALGVPAEVFREAFSRVRPAPGGTRPDSQRVHDNKRELLTALEKYGITNERLDEVSDYYRYRPEAGEMWPVRAAAGYVVLEKGRVKKVVITDGGFGYTSLPKLGLSNGKAVDAKIQLKFDKEYAWNGRLVDK